MSRRFPAAKHPRVARRNRRESVGLLLVLFTVATAGLAAESTDNDPWILLHEAREALSAAPLSATFTQAFRPAGFTGEDLESGRLHLDLPDCVRWDYREPFAKSYLLCDEIVFMWNEGESSGRRFAIRAAEQPGLDLMTLQVDRLRNRYAATVAEIADDRIELALEPLELSGELVSASVVIDRGERCPVRIEYIDRQGNRTRFDIEDYAPLDNTDRFEPPAEIEWLEP